MDLYIETNFPVRQQNEGPNNPDNDENNLSDLNYSDEEYDTKTVFDDFF